MSVLVSRWEVGGRKGRDDGTILHQLIPKCESGRGCQLGGERGGLFGGHIRRLVRLLSQERGQFRPCVSVRRRMLGIHFHWTTASAGQMTLVDNDGSPKLAIFPLFLLWGRDAQGMGENPPGASCRLGAFWRVHTSSFGDGGDSVIYGKKRGQVCSPPRRIRQRCLVLLAEFPIHPVCWAGDGFFGISGVLRA
jgi:hypothetical protein